MISKPNDLGGWNLNLVHEIAMSGLGENDWYDLKADLQSADHQRKAVAAFANTEGGFLVYGVTDSRDVAGVESQELPRDFGNKLIDGLSPSIGYQFGPPIPVRDGRFLWICHIPRSKRGPHGVLDKASWIFPKRTASGSNVTMTVEEIRLAFADAGRKRQDLLWLKAEVTRIFEVAEHLNVLAHAEVPDIDVLLTRIDVAQLKTAIVPLFGEIGDNAQLVSSLHLIIEHGSRLDTAMAPLAAFALIPRDRSYSGTRTSPKSLITEIAPQVVMAAKRVLQMLPGVTS